jgi:hypothetical protein
MINLVKFKIPIPIKVIESFLNNPSYEIREETNTVVLDYFETALDIKINQNSEIEEVYCYDEFLCNEENLLGFAYAILPEDGNYVTAFDSLGTEYKYDKKSLEEFLEEY